MSFIVVGFHNNLGHSSFRWGNRASERGIHLLKVTQQRVETGSCLGQLHDGASREHILSQVNWVIISGIHWFMFFLSLGYYARCWKHKENLSYAFKMDDCYVTGSVSSSGTNWSIGVAVDSNSQHYLCSLALLPGHISPRNSHQNQNVLWARLCTGLGGVSCNRKKPAGTLHASPGKGHVHLGPSLGKVVVLDVVAVKASTC